MISSLSQLDSYQEEYLGKMRGRSYVVLLVVLKDIYTDGHTVRTSFGKNIFIHIYTSSRLLTLTTKSPHLEPKYIALLCNISYAAYAPTLVHTHT